MTIEDFNKTGFRAGDNGIYKNKEYEIASLDFEEKLIGLLGVCEGGEDDDITWVRCESVIYVPFSE